MAACRLPTNLRSGALMQEKGPSLPFPEIMKISPAIIIAGVIAIAGITLAFRKASAVAEESAALERESAGRDLPEFRSAWREAHRLEGGRKRGIPGAKSIAWYEAALEKYPDMKPDYRDVPDERNGYLRILEIVHGWDATIVPEDLRAMLRPGGEWDAEKLHQWHRQHGELIREVLEIADLEDRSAKGIPFDRIFQRESKNGFGDLGLLLPGLARMAAEEGDDAGALRHLAANLRIGRHLTGTEAPSVLAKVLDETLRSKSEQAFFDHHLGRISGTPEALRQWRDALYPPQDRAEEMQRVCKGEWNYMMRCHLAPHITGEMRFEGPEFEVRDPEAFTAAYTRVYQHWMADLAAQDAGRFIVSGWNTKPVGGQLDKATAMMLEETFKGMEGIMTALGTTTTRTVRGSAALAVLLGEEMPVDPVSGTPYVWDPVARTVSHPSDDDAEEITHVPAP